MRCLLLPLIAMTAALGCANWHSEAPSRALERGLPPPRRESGTAVLEIAFVSLKPAPHEVDLWQQVDQTVIPTDLRHEWERNGLRIGRVQKPADFSELLGKIRRRPDGADTAMEASDVLSDLSHQARRITCRIGKRYELPVRQPAPTEQTVLIRLREQTVGRTLSRAQPLFALRSTAVDPHSIRLSLRPEIQHGEMRQTWVGSDSALRLDSRRDSWNIDELATEVRLEKNSILIAGGFDPPRGLGQWMFTGLTAEGDDDRVVMVIRVAELPDQILP